MKIMASSTVSFALSLIAIAVACCSLYRSSATTVDGRPQLIKLFPSSSRKTSFKEDYLKLPSANILKKPWASSSQHKLSQQACVFSAVKQVVEAAIDAETRMGASLIRLFFHDCFVDGCDGGILLNDTNTFTGEQTAPGNLNSVRGFPIIDQAKENVVASCPDINVSCADILAIAARDSVVKLGGQTYTVNLGRRDARSANLTGATDQLVGPSETLASQTRKFSNKGFNQTELVTLVGAHTVGFSRCALLCNSNNTNPARFSGLQCNCPVSANDTADVVQLDPTPATFDQRYFQDVANGQGLLFSDNEFLKSNVTSAAVARYRDSVSTFFSDFAAAMVKMGNLPPSAGVDLEIREACSRVNANSVADA